MEGVGVKQCQKKIGEDEKKSRHTHIKKNNIPKIIKETIVNQ